MKRKTSGPAKKARAQAIKKPRRAAGPIHKRVLLHPFTAFVLLCVGVLVAGSTFRSQAESYDVTASVSAASITQPAIIVGPGNQQHVTEEVTTVTGACPDRSYIKLYRNNVFSGSAVCEGGRFSIVVSLHLGANDLEVRVFNMTDEEGPKSNAITIYYDLPVKVRAPTASPTDLRISNVEQGSYKEGVAREVGDRPTISGLAPPFSDIVVTFYSIPSVCKTKANGQGVWSCTLANSLAPGLHHVVVTATTPAGKTLTFPTFEIKVTTFVEPFIITSDYKYKAYQQGQAYSWQLGLSGGTSPYELEIDWGDGSTSKLTRPDGSEFLISHTYNSPEVTLRNYSVIITAVDARGATTVLQLTASVQATIIPVSSGKNIVAAFMAEMRQWLWMVWPVYIAVVLMALSFWIGEREAYQRFLMRKRRPAGRAR